MARERSPERWLQCRPSLRIETFTTAGKTFNTEDTEVHRVLLFLFTLDFPSSFFFFSQAAPVPVSLPATLERSLAAGLRAISCGPAFAEYLPCRDRPRRTVFPIARP